MRLYSILLCLFLIFFTSVSQASDKQKYDLQLAEGIQHMTHGRTTQCSAALEGILKTYRLSKEEKKYIYGLLSANAEIAGDYSSQYSYLVKMEGKKNPSSAQQFAKILSELPLQAIEKPSHDAKVNYLIDSLYYEGKFAGCEIRIPITINGDGENVILDNGCAKFCAASGSFAKKHGIRPVGAGGEGVGVAGTASVWFGICDSLSVGELTFRNIIFTVFPDEFIDNSVLELNAMLGANIFRLAGEMAFDNGAKTITFPAVQQERESNVVIDSDGIHYVEALVDGLTCTLQLDLGAARTSLSANFYKANEEKIKSDWNQKTSHIGGVGAMKETIVFVHDTLPVTACGGTFIRGEVEVSTERKPNESKEYGSIGNDFLLSFDKAVLNLNAMYFYVD